MNLARFLILDTVLILLTLIIYINFKDNEHKLATDFNVNAETLPSLEDILEMENLAKKNGSGIEIDSLLGHWQFVSVWKQNADKEDKLSSSLLRLFSASLDLRKLTSDKDFPTLSLSNTIEFGPLLIRFLGLGGIRGKQPLLPFFFERIELKLGKLVLINRLLNEPDEKDMPFFSLIAKSNKDGWLVARGRGGGIALWLMSNK